MTDVLAASHVHSEWSYDAEWPLERLVAEFGRRGYRVLLVTDHDKGFDQARFEEHAAACRQHSTDSVLVVPGMEYADADNVVHVLVWGDVPFLGEGIATEELLERVSGHAGTAVLAHPWRKRAWERVQPSWFERLAGIEIWNRKYDGWRVGSEAAQMVADSGLKAFVGHDFHRRNQFFPMGMRLSIEGPASEASVVASLRAEGTHAVSLGVGVERYARAPLRHATNVAEGLRRVARKIRDSARGGS